MPRRRAAASTEATSHTSPSGVTVGGLALWSPRDEDDRAYDKTHKKGRQGDNLLRVYEGILSLFLVLLFFLTVAALSLYVLPQPTPGLYTPHVATFEATPSSKVARTACIANSEQAVIRAFTARHWNVVEIDEDVESHAYLPCHVDRKASIIWTKHKPGFWGKAAPWQRHNWILFQNAMSRKSTFQLILNNYTHVTGRKMEFIPDSFVLPDDRDRLLRRLEPSRLGNADGGGENEPWVVKLSATDNGIGIGIVGPQSPGLHLLADTLRQHTDPKDYMDTLREKIVLQQENDNRDPEQVQRARERSIRQDDEIIVQRYVCHELAYQTHKFDLRIYFLIASVDPLVVLYHDGSLRVALSQYNDQKFGSTAEHLTNIGRNRAIDNCTATFDAWDVALREHVAQAPSGQFTATVAADPLGHIRNQIKAALADMVAASRDKAFHGYRGKTTMENGFSLMGGDFIVDRDLHVWMTECQSSPGLGHETSARKALYAKLLPSTVDIITHVMDKQGAGQPIFPMEDVVGDFELIYTDDFQFRYEFLHKEQRGPC